MRWHAAARRVASGLVMGLCLCLDACNKSASSAQPESEVLVAAAASLRGVMPDIVAAYGKAHAEGRERFAMTYGASGDLRQQVAGGAPVDVVVFASGKPVEDLIKARLVDPATRKVVASNALVLIGARGGRGSKPLAFATLDTVPVGDKIAIGNPKTVPAGQYAEETLRGLGKWDAVQPHLVFTGDVSGVIAYVRRGEVAAGVAYKTELHGIADVEVLDEVKPDGSRPGSRPEVVAAVTTGARDAAHAKALVDFLASPEAQRILADYGFGPP